MATADGIDEGIEAEVGIVVNLIQAWEKNSGLLVQALFQERPRTLYSALGDPRASGTAAQYWMRVGFLFYRFPEFYGLLSADLATHIRSRSLPGELELCRAMGVMCNRPRKAQYGGHRLQAWWEWGCRLWGGGVGEFEDFCEGLRGVGSRGVWFPGGRCVLTLGVLAQMTADAIQGGADWFTLLLLRYYWVGRRALDYYEHVEAYKRWGGDSRDLRGLGYRSFLQEQLFPQLLLWERLDRASLMPSVRGGVGSYRMSSSEFQVWVREHLGSSRWVTASLEEIERSLLPAGVCVPGVDRSRDAALLGEILELDRQRERLLALVADLDLKRKTLMGQRVAEFKRGVR